MWRLRTLQKELFFLGGSRVGAAFSTQNSIFDFRASIAENQPRSYFGAEFWLLFRRLDLISKIRFFFLQLTQIYVFRGLVLQDLTFVQVGNNDYLSDDVINFSKRWQQFNIVENMKRFKKVWVIFFSNKYRS